MVRDTGIERENFVADLKRCNQTPPCTTNPDSLKCACPSPVPSFPLPHQLPRMIQRETPTTTKPDPNQAAPARSGSLPPPPPLPPPDYPRGLWTHHHQLNVCSEMPKSSLCDLPFLPFYFRQVPIKQTPYFASVPFPCSPSKPQHDVDPLLS